MARKRGARETKKLKDKWKAKQWYTIIAPDMFDRAIIGETLADDPSKLIGRAVEVTLQDLTGDFKMMHVKLKFKIVDHSTTEAYTRFLGHDLTSDYIRRQTRRKRTKMEGVFDVMTKEGYKVRIKPMAISDKRIQSSVQYLIRKRMAELIREIGENHTFPELVSLVLTSDREKALVTAINRVCRPIYPLKRVDIRKMEVLKAPEKEPESDSVSIGVVPKREEEVASEEAQKEERPKESPVAEVPEKENRSEEKAP